MILTAKARNEYCVIYHDGDVMVKLPADHPFAGEDRIHVSISPARGFGTDRTSYTAADIGLDPVDWER